MMTNQQHPITPPPELRCQWQAESPFKVISVEREDYMIDRATQWGSDQELEACCALMDDWGLEASDLRAARRPKPPSLKEQALSALRQIADGKGDILEQHQSLDTIRRALEALPND